MPYTALNSSSSRSPRRGFLAASKVNFNAEKSPATASSLLPSLESGADSALAPLLVVASHASRPAAAVAISCVAASVRTATSWSR